MGTEEGEDGGNGMSPEGGSAPLCEENSGSHSSEVCLWRRMGGTGEANYLKGLLKQWNNAAFQTPAEL